jgi:predicted branched-subunit amino acid permease
MKQAALSAAFATLIATLVYAGLGYFLNYGFTLSQTAIYAVIFFGFMTIANYVRHKS